jgi:hypothetical protein
MNALKNAIALRRAELAGDFSESCVALGAPNPAVVFATWRDGVWVLPWVHFTSAHLIKCDEGERISFVFAQHAIKADGVHLRPLMQEIAAFRLHALREWPPTAPTPLNAVEPLVRQLTVIRAGST